MKKIKLIIIEAVLIAIGSTLVCLSFYNKEVKSQIKSDSSNISVKVNVLNEETISIPTDNESSDNIKDKKTLSKTEESKKSAKSSSISKTKEKNIPEESESKPNTVSDETNKNRAESSDSEKESISSKNSEIEKDTSKQEEAKTDKVIEFYKSITGGKKEFSSEEEALTRGLEIKNRELDYVLDYNMNHIDAQIKSNIKYYRVYPSVVDSTGKTWYYLHFFCEDGNNNDEKLKKMF